MSRRRGVDPAAARNDLATFAEMVGWPMTDWQARALALEARSTVLVAGRQMGKSRSLALLALWWAFRQPGQRVLVVSAGEEASRRLLATARQIAAGSPLLTGSVVDEGTALLRLTNGSEVRSVPASERQVRGWSADLLLVDEAAMLTDELLLGAAFPTTAARPDARIVLASTPLATDGAFYRNAMSGMDGSSPHVRTFTWKAKAAGGEQEAAWITRAVIEHQEATLSSDRFRREYLCEWSAASDVLFTPSLVESCSADLELPTLETIAGPAQLFAGLDWAGGTGRDRTVLASIARLPIAHLNDGGQGPVYVAWLLAEWQQTQIHHVSTEIVASSGGFDVLSTEANGLGLPATDELRRIYADQLEARRKVARMSGEPWAWTRVKSPMFNPIPMNAARKADAYFRLKTMCERGQLVFARDEGLIRELTGLRAEYRPTGTVGIEAASLAGHDDRADAVMLATAPYRTGAARTVLGEIAAKAGPESDQGEVGETTETGGGLIVPRKPALQSVRGSELTLPEVPRALRSPQDENVNRIRAELAQWRK